MDKALVAGRAECIGAYMRKLFAASDSQPTRHDNPSAGHKEFAKRGTLAQAGRGDGDLSCLAAGMSKANRGLGWLPACKEIADTLRTAMRWREKHAD